MSTFITIFPNNQGGVRYMVQEDDTRRVLKQGELQSEGDLSDAAVAQGFPELGGSDRTTLLELMRRVVETWYPEKFTPA